MTYAKQAAEREERIANVMFDRLMKRLDETGEQPLDPETGEPVARTPSRDEMEMHILLRNDPELTLKMMAKEARREDLSDGFLPKKWLQRRTELEARYLKLRGQLEGPDQSLPAEAPEAVSPSPPPATPVEMNDGLLV